MSAAGGPDLVTNGLVLHFDAASRRSYNGGTIWRDLAGNNNGILVNGPTFNSANGGSIVFDGVNDFVNLGIESILKFTTNFTINLWLKFANLTGVRTIISNNESGGYGIITNLGSTRIETYYYINGNYYKAGEDIFNYNTTLWINIAVTFNGSTIIFYRNGILRESVLISGSVTTTSEPLILGANPRMNGTEFTDFFAGNIAQVQMYNRAITPAEVRQNYNATRSRFGV